MNELENTGVTETTVSQNEEDMAKHPTENCIKSCQFDGMDPPKKSKECAWVRCCLCTHWYHPMCVNLPQDETAGVWACHSCRNVANDVSKLKETINILLDIVRRNTTSLNDLMSTQSETFNVVKRLHEKSEASTAAVAPQPAPVQKQSLLIGDSLIKNIEATASHMKVMTNVSKLANVTSELKKFDKLESIFIVNGTNDCNSQRDATDIVEDFKSLLNEAKGRADKVVLSSIVPRTDKPDVLEKINTVNQMLVVVTNEAHVTFINNDENFLYRNNSVDKNLLQLDECHLSHLGVTRLIENLKLQDLVSSTLAPPKKSEHNGPSSEPWNKVIRRRKKMGIQPEKDEIVNQDHHPDGNKWNIPPAPPIPSPPSSKTKIFFQGHLHPLSNFFPCNIELYKEHFACAEAAYQYRKAIEYEEWNLADEILYSTRGNDAKRLGDKVSTDQRWWDIRESVMLEVLNAKVKQCPEFHNTLLASQGNALVEDTPHEFWARGRNGNGQNRLGSLLEYVRARSPPRAKSKFEGNTQKRRQQNECFNCGEQNHNTSRCRWGQPIVCHHCHTPGHKKKFCSRSQAN